MNKEGTARAKTQPADIALDAVTVPWLAEGDLVEIDARRAGRDGMGWDGMDGMG